MIGAKLDFFEYRRIRFETNQCAVGLAAQLALFLALQFSLFERRLDKLAFAMAANKKIFGEGIDRLGADAIQPDAELEHIVIVFCAGINLGNAIHNLAQWNAAAKIAHAYVLTLDGDLDFLARAHDELINGIID